MITKLVQRFGNGAHVVLPKEYIGKKIRFIAETKTFDDIKSQALEILRPHLENMLGIYLYGSYARNEQTMDSDIDILVITNTKLKTIDKIDDFSVISITVRELESTLQHNAVLILPIIKEAKTLINPILLDKYKDYTFTRKNTKLFIADSIKVLDLNKKGLQLDFELGSIVYSLILRIRGLLMIKFMLIYKPYSKLLLFNYLESNGLHQNKLKELYKIYNKEKNNIKIKESSIITRGDLAKLLTIAENLLEEVKNSLE